MRKIERTPAPDYFGEKSKTQKHFVFDSLSDMTEGHCAFCDVILLKAGMHVVHFKPEKEFPELSFDWSNLYISCPICFNAKLDKYDKDLLRPDAEDYSFDRYFICNWKTGEIQPNPSANREDQKKARVTIEIFNLNDFGRDVGRIKELDHFQTLYYAKPSSHLSPLDFSYSYYLERSLRRSFEIFENIKVVNLKIKNIKCFQDIEFNFNPSRKSSLIIGTNARGKTTILQLIAIALCNITDVPFNYCWQEVVKKGEDEGTFEISILHKEKTLTLKFKVTTDDRITCVQGAEEFQSIHGKIVLAYGANRNTKTEGGKPYKDIEPIATLFGENAYLKHIQQSSTYSYLRLHFKAVQGLINEIFKVSDPQNVTTLVGFDTETFYFKTYSNQDEQIPLGALSEGFKATFVWLLDMIIRLVEMGGNIYNKENISGIILIDEVDLHLHPLWQRTILHSLEEILPSIQFIITSHSMFVSQSVPSNEIIKLTVDEQGKIISDPELEEINAELSYASIGRDIFDIQSPYNYKTEIQLKEFKELKKRLLQKEPVEEEFKQKCRELAQKGVELAGVIQRELLMIEDQTGKELDPWTE